ncbi:MAG: copper chaperone PCu(A)C [Alphaproteobacteria bacterium]|nr:copper chaperone PCu(A)C [Alphaproteobacteria bacterium]
MKRRILLALALWPTLAMAHSYKLNSLAIGHAWGLPTKNDETQIFMPFLNLGTMTDRLIGVKTPSATGFALRLNDDATTAPEAAFVLEPGKPMPMRPTARHISLLNMAKPLAKGDQVSLTLVFEKAGETTIEVHIQDKAGE